MDEFFYYSLISIVIGCIIPVILICAMWIHHWYQDKQRYLIAHQQRIEEAKKYQDTVTIIQDDIKKLKKENRKLLKDNSLH
jgi:hypothetical protein